MLSNIPSVSNQLVLAGLGDLAYSDKTSLSNNDTVNLRVIRKYC